MLILIIMIVVLLPIAILCLKRYLFDVGDDLCGIVGTLAAIVLVLAIAYVISLKIGCHEKNNEELIKSRPYIVAAIQSDDPVFREQAVQEAIEYNSKVQKGKNARNSIWTNWFNDRIWDDAEFIALDMSDVTVKGASE